MAARLIVSLTADGDVAGLESFAEPLPERRLPLSLLVRPVGPEGPLAPRSRRAGWLRERHSGGDALVLRGDDHSPCRRGGVVRSAVCGDDLRRPERRDAVCRAVDLVLGHGAAGATYASITDVALAD